MGRSKIKSDRAEVMSEASEIDFEASKALNYPLVT